MTMMVLADIQRGAVSDNLDSCDISHSEPGRTAPRGPTCIDTGGTKSWLLTYARNHVSTVHRDSVHALLQVPKPSSLSILPLLDIDTEGFMPNSFTRLASVATISFDQLFEQSLGICLFAEPATSSAEMSLF